MRLDVVWPKGAQMRIVREGGMFIGYPVRPIENWQATEGAPVPSRGT